MSKCDRLSPPDALQTVVEYVDNAGYAKLITVTTEADDWDCCDGTAEDYLAHEAWIQRMHVARVILAQHTGNAEGWDDDEPLIDVTDIDWEYLPAVFEAGAHRVTEG